MGRNQLYRAEPATPICEAQAGVAGRFPLKPDMALGFWDGFRPDGPARRTSPNREPGSSCSPLDAGRAVSSFGLGRSGPEPAQTKFNLDRIVAVAIEVKGLPDHARLRKHIADTARALLMRMGAAREGAARGAGTGRLVGVGGVTAVRGPLPIPAPVHGRRHAIASPTTVFTCSPLLTRR